MSDRNQNYIILEVFRAWCSAYRLLDSSLKKNVRAWLVVSLFGRSIQILGVVSIMPFVALISVPDVIQHDGVMGWAYQFSGSENYQEFLLYVGIVTILVYLLTIGFTCFEVWYGTRLSSRIGVEFSTRLFGIYIYKDYPLFLKKNRAEALKLVTEEVEETLVGLLVTGIEIISNVSLALLITAVLMLASIEAAVGSALTLLLAYMLLGRYFSREIEFLGKRLYQLGVAKVATVQEMLGGIREIKVCETEQRYVTQYRRLSAEKAQHTNRYAIMEFLPRQFLEAVTFIGIVVFALLSMFAHESPESVLPTIALFGISAYRLIPTLREIYQNIETIVSSKHAINRLLSEFKYEVPSAQQQVNIEPIALGDPLLTFNDVSFRYPGADLMAIENVSFSIEQGGCTALTGSSGRGKSTVTDIIAGLLQPDSGIVAIGGVELCKPLTLRWRRQVSYISQDVYLFDGTIMENICMQADVPISVSNRVSEVCKIAQLDGYIGQLSQGYDTALGVGKKSLSGGQLKRLGLARALYRDPDLLILDETLNEIDSATQQSIMTALREVRGLTLLVISHDPRVLEFCDKQVRL